MMKRTALPHLHGLLLIALATALLTAPAAWAAEGCATCGKALPERYLKDQESGKSYCSKACYAATRPQCVICGQALTDRYLQSDDQLFCSEACLLKSLPACAICGKRNHRYATFRGQVFCAEHASSPRCNECQLPFGKGHELSDGRRLCAACRVHAIFDMKDAQLWYDHARQEVQAITGYTIGSPPRLALADRHKLAQLMHEQIFADDATVVRGCYERSEQVEVRRGPKGDKHRMVAIDERITLLFGQTRDNFVAGAVHELTHDLLADRFPHMRKTPLWVQEGICQYLSAVYCHKHQLLDALQTIEESPNPVYGDGYRYFKRKFGENNWSGLHYWLRNGELSELTQHAPAE